MHSFLHRIIITKHYWIVLLILASLPSCSIVLFGYYRLHQLEKLMEITQSIYEKVSYNELMQKKQEKILHQLNNCDPLYLDTYVEPLCFLQSEQKKLRNLLQENRQDPSCLQRLQWLSQQNRLSFSEEKIRKNPLFREVEEKQQTTIQIDEEDLKQLLCLIEQVHIWPYGPKPGTPYLFISDFQLVKKTISPEQKVFCLDMKLIKREPL